jgi:selenide,water dikinase
MPVDLFKSVVECGCAAKVPAGSLAGILCNVGLGRTPEIVVGPETLDDAGVYRLPDGQYLVQTVDYFPPVARDPYVYGQIAAANSLSDVYAMGGRPLTALAIVCFPSSSPGPEVLEEITRGAVEKLNEAGAALLGGHSVVDPQIKYGLAVTGVVAPDDLTDNAHARPDELLVLTKPLGTGVTIMAVRAGMAGPGQEEAANRSMAALNREAAALGRESGASSCTDVTGFGLLGHAIQMARASGVSFEIWTDRLPLLDGALEHAATGLLSAAAYSNRDYVGRAVEFAGDVTLAEQDLLFDPQTSGGLLVSCPGEGAEQMLEKASRRLATPCAIVGRVTATDGESKVTVVRTPPDGAPRAPGGRRP